MVNQQLLMPQEIEVFYVIPAIRRGLSRAMKSKGVSQKRIAALLCIRESTVSQYLNEKRGNHVTFSENITRQMGEAAERIRTPQDLVRETQALLAKIRQTNVLCRMHRKLANLPGTCTLSRTGCI